ncbi:MAG: hypothetical protein JWO01_2035 [Microbacteriaceae bacterium]|nr:hypothetical protein [Microbacteriaceae bacterium]
MSKTRYTLAITAAVATAVTLAACSSTTSSGSMGGMPGMGASNSATAAPNAGPHNAQDTSFTQEMIVHHTGAIAMADLAATRASSTQVKTLASQIKAAQQPEINLMTSWLKVWGEPVMMPGMASPSPTPTASDMSGMDMSTPMPSASGMDSSMPGMTPEDMATLSSETGAAFDREFLTLMIEHHQSAVSMANDELSKGQNTAAKKLAQSIVTSQSKQISSMKTMLSSLG